MIAIFIAFFITEVSSRYNRATEWPPLVETMLNPNIEFDVDQIAWIGFYRAGISRYSPSDVIICSAKETKSFAVKLNFLYVRTTRSITWLSGRILRRMLIILALAGLVLGDLAWLTGHEPLA